MIFFTLLEHLLMPQSYHYAFRQFQFKVKRENFCNVHVSLVPRPKATGWFPAGTCCYRITSRRWVDLISKRYFQEQVLQRSESQLVKTDGRTLTNL